MNDWDYHKKNLLSWVGLPKILFAEKAAMAEEFSENVKVSNLKSYALPIY